MTSEQKLADAVIEQARQDGGEKMLTCAEAFKLAKRFDAEIIEVGRICNRAGIKIRKCQLGCFA
jgi:hypothetical protein